MTRKPYVPPRAARIVEVDPSIGPLVEANGGYCPCLIDRNEDNKCMCRDFREMDEGMCHCGRFEKRRA